MEHTPYNTYQDKLRLTLPSLCCHGTKKTLQNSEGFRVNSLYRNSLYLAKTPYQRLEYTLRERSREIYHNRSQSKVKNDQKNGYSYVKHQKPAKRIFYLPRIKQLLAYDGAYVSCRRHFDSVVVLEKVNKIRKRMERSNKLALAHKAKNPYLYNKCEVECRNMEEAVENTPLETPHHCQSGSGKSRLRHKIMEPEHNSTETPKSITQSEQTLSYQEDFTEESKSSKQGKLNFDAEMTDNNKNEAEVENADKDLDTESEQNIPHEKSKTQSEEAEFDAKSNMDKSATSPAPAQSDKMDEEDSKNGTEETATDKTELKDKAKKTQENHKAPKKAQEIRVMSVIDDKKCKQVIVETPWEKALVTYECTKSREDENFFEPHNDSQECDVQEEDVKYEIKETVTTVTKVKEDISSSGISLSNNTIKSASAYSTSSNSKSVLSLDCSATTSSNRSSSSTGTYSSSSILSSSPSTLSDSVTRGRSCPLELERKTGLTERKFNDREDDGEIDVNPIPDIVQERNASLDSDMKNSDSEKALVNVEEKERDNHTAMTTNTSSTENTISQESESDSSSEYETCSDSSEYSSVTSITESNQEHIEVDKKQKNLEKPIVAQIEYPESCARRRAEESDSSSNYTADSDPDSSTTTYSSSEDVTGSESEYESSDISSSGSSESAESTTDKDGELSVISEQSTITQESISSKRSVDENFSSKRTDIQLTPVPILPEEQLKSENKIKTDYLGVKRTEPTPSPLIPDEDLLLGTEYNGRNQNYLNVNQSKLTPSPIVPEEELSLKTGYHSTTSSSYSLEFDRSDRIPDKNRSVFVEDKKHNCVVKMKPPLQRGSKPETRIDKFIQLTSVVRKYYNHKSEYDRTIKKQ